MGADAVSHWLCSAVRCSGQKAACPHGPMNLPACRRKVPEASTPPLTTAVNTTLNTLQAVCQGLTEDFLTTPRDTLHIHRTRGTAVRTPSGHKCTAGAGDRVGGKCGSPLQTMWVLSAKKRRRKRETLLQTNLLCLTPKGFYICSSCQDGTLQALLGTQSLRLSQQVWFDPQPYS